MDILESCRASSPNDGSHDLHARCLSAADEIAALRRWKSTHAPRLEALQGLKEHAQAEAALGTEARTSLASEREANAILTAEIEALRALVQEVLSIASAGLLPDGDEVNTSTLLWAEAWARKLRP